MKATSEPSMVMPMMMEARHMAMIELMGVPVRPFTCKGYVGKAALWAVNGDSSAGGWQGQHRGMPYGRAAQAQTSCGMAGHQAILPQAHSCRLPSAHLLPPAPAKDAAVAGKGVEHAGVGGDAEDACG